MIYITGDIHRNPIRFSSRFFPEGKDMTKDDYVIVCGDFGLIWDYEGESSEENYWLNWLDNKPWTTLFVPGNHENYDRLYGIDDPALLKCWLYDNLTESQKDNLYAGYPEKRWHDGMVRALRPSVLMLERGYIFNLCGKKFFSFGGASSHDIADGILHPEYLASKAEMNKIYKQWNEENKMFRVSHTTWWRQEMPTEEEMCRGIKTLEDNDWMVDFVVTHCAPSSTLALLSHGCYKPDKLNSYLEEIKQKLKYTKWFFGHYHDNKNVTQNDLCIYEQIIRIV